MIWLAKTVNDRLNVVETLRFQTVKKHFACVSVDMKNAVTTVYLFNVVNRISFFLSSASLICRSTDFSKYFREPLGIQDNESRV